jgi:hypothetical protein
VSNADDEATARAAVEAARSIRGTLRRNDAATRMREMITTTTNPRTKRTIERRLAQFTNGSRR